MAFQDTRYTLAYGVLAIAIVVSIGYLLLNAKPAQAPESVSVATTTPDGLTQTYASSTLGFSIRYPEGYVVESDTYSGPGMAAGFAGIKLTVPHSLTIGTNLADDSYIAVDRRPDLSACLAESLIEGGMVDTSTVTESGVTYTVASITGAAAGNRYEETFFALQGTQPCVVVRYSVHYGVIENYPPGTVREFDKTALLAQFDAIRRSLVIGQ
jgi:hypothetical protein